MNSCTGGFTGIVTANSYNPRLQPIVISATAPSQTVLSFTYGFGLGTANNGNVLAIQNNRLLERSQSFTYDQLNRIATAQSAANSGANCWGESFGYDIWGNLLNRGTTKTDPSCQYEALSLVATTQNQVSGFTYDAAGNLTHDCCATTYVYDAENRLSTLAGVTYTYDGDGKRAKKSGGTLYWTGIGSDALGESDLAGTLTAEYVFFGGKRMARLDLPSGAVHYYFSDHLGSSNVVTNATGATIENESDFYPFGGERFVVYSGGNNYKFTGKERDTESGLDYFGARYYWSNVGRFMTPDWAAAPSAVPYANFGNPQSLNLYSYVQNNPTTMGDPDGHEVPGTPDVDPQRAIDSTVFLGQELVGLGKGFINAAPATYNAFAELLNAQGASTGQPYIELPMAPTLPINSAGEAVGAAVATLGLVAAGGAEGVGGTPRGGAGIVANAERGAASEARVLEDIGAAKNTKPVAASEGKSIPDLQDSRVVGEIKDAKTVSNTRQIRIQKEAAQQSGREHQLITAPRRMSQTTPQRGRR